MIKFKWFCYNYFSGSIQKSIAFSNFDGTNCRGVCRTFSKSMMELFAKGVLNTFLYSIWFEFRKIPIFFFNSLMKKVINGKKNSRKRLRRIRATDLRYIHIHLPRKYTFIDILTHLFGVHPFSNPWKRPKTLMFSDAFSG